MRQQRRKKYPLTLAEIAAEVSKMRMEKGDSEEEAMDFGFEVAELIRRRWGGDQVYIPKGNHFFLSKRNEEMIQKFNGGNHAEISAEYGITERQFYSILAAHRANQKAQRKEGVQ